MNLKTNSTYLAQTISALFLLPFGIHHAYADDTLLHSILIEGARGSLIGITDAASSGIIDQKKIQAMTTYRPGEILEAIPGVIVSQHSGEGKANQFYLRGFNLDHGTDLRTSLDDMPVNQRSHAHGQGWTDMNFVIPELAARIDYKKGPYSATNGDFSAAGAANISYANRLGNAISSITLGEYGYQRAVIANSPEVGNGSLLYAIEALHNNGPFVKPDNFRKFNGVLRYSEGFANNGYSLTAMMYQGKWNASDQIPLRAIQNTAIQNTAIQNKVLKNRFDTVDSSDGGQAHRYSLSGVWRQTSAEQASKISAYLINSQLDLFSNFTYFMDDPINGDQFSQPDKRVTSGINASHTWHTHSNTIADANNITTDISIGAQLQNDNIFNALQKTSKRQVLSTVRQDHIVESSLGAYVDVSTRWNVWWRTNVGLRHDAYQFKVAGDRAANSGKANDNMWSPTLSIVLGPWNKTEWYVNVGTGFHSNDARATLTTIDPQSLAATEKAPGLVKAQGSELGMRTAFIPKLQSSISVYQLNFDSELNFVGDAGTTEAGRPSRRYGIEISNSYQVNNNIAIELDTAFTKARYRDQQAEGNNISGAVEGVAQLSMTIDKIGPWSGALRLRYFGPRPLIENNSVRSKASTTLNGRISYQWNSKRRIEIEGFNLANQKASAIDYYYASQLKGEANPVEDIHFHPIEPRHFRVMLIQQF